MPDSTLSNLSSHSSFPSYEPSLAPSFAQLLSQCEDELRALLNTIDHSRSVDTAEHEVSDFKDLADEQTLARLDRTNARRVEDELQEVSKAQRRLAEHRYGICEDCGQSIDLRRLTALPHSAFCAACQAQHEQQASGKKSHRAY